MGRCSVCSVQTNKGCAKCTTITPESYCCPNCETSEKFIAHLKSHKIARTVGMRHGSYKGEILITCPRNGNPNLERTLPFLAPTLQNFLPGWKVESSYDLEYTTLEKPDVILILYSLIGRPTVPQYGNFFERAVLESKNVIYLGIEYTAQVRTAPTTFSIPEEYDEGGFELGPNRVQYNFRLLANPKDKLIYNDAEQNTKNINNFKSLLERYVGGSSDSQPQVPKMTAPIRIPEIKPQPSTKLATETQELRVQIAEVTNEEAKLRAEIARLGAQDLANRETISRLERENRTIRGEHEKMRKECMNAVEALQRILGQY